MTTPQSNLIDKTFTGSVFKLPAELEADFDQLCVKINDAAHAAQSFRLASLWVEFYMKFDAYFVGVTN